MADIFGTAAGAVTGVGMGLLNNYFGQMREEAARRENYKYNEMAAENADKRTRALYNDIYSPEALKQQYMKAGLSPSLMFGGTPGQGGTAGAQGAGVSQGSTYMPISMLEGAQIANLAAQTANINADTENKKVQNEGIKLDNKIKECEAVIKGWETDLKKTDYNILTMRYKDDDGNLMNVSFYNLAENSNNYDEFIKKVHTYNYSQDDRERIQSEQGQKMLRDIYKTAHTFNSEIEAVRINKDLLNSKKELTDEEKNLKIQEVKQAEFQTKVVQALEAAGFPNMNAQATIQVLKTQIAQSELTETQKNAWNRLINKMGDSTMTDIVIVLLSVLQGFSGSISMGFSKKL